MSRLRIVPPAHECQMPRVKVHKHGVGTEFTCDCGQRWVLAKWWITWAGDTADWKKA